MKKTERIYVAGHRGLVGSALIRVLEEKGFSRIITRTRGELDLIDQAATEEFFKKEKPDHVFLAAAKVGGIRANQTQGGAFIYENLALQTNVIHSAYRHGVKRLLFLGSSCIYPRLAPQPIREECLLTGTLEPTNEPYAIAKIAGIKMCEAYNRQYGTHFISVMSTNLYGPNDNFDPETSHVLPALIRKFHEAKAQGLDRVVLWGTGRVKREFLYVDDLAQACVLLMQQGTGADGEGIVNVGCGEDLTIDELAQLIADVVGYRGKIEHDSGKPDGTPRKLLDISRIRKIGWSPQMPLREGLEKTYEWYRKQGESRV